MGYTNPYGADPTSPYPGYAPQISMAPPQPRTVYTGGADPSSGLNPNPWAYPGAIPDFIPGYNPNTTSLWGKMNGTINAINPNMDGINAFRQEALRTGPSRWSQLANQQQQMLATNSRSNAAATNAGQNAQAESDLAMRGGVDSGARERIAREGSKNLFDMNAKIGQDQASNQMQIGMNDEQNRISQLGSLPGLENQALQPQFEKAKMLGQAEQFDIANQMQDAANRNQYNMGKYQTQMYGWGAGQQANATMNSKSGSSFICTALRKHGLMSLREAVLMTRFMLRGVFTRADFFAWYFRHGKKAVELAERQRFDWSKVKAHFVDDILRCLKEKGEVAAQNLYAERAGQFCTMFLGPCGYSDKLARPGLVKSLIALPRVFTLRSTYEWLGGYLSAKFTRKVKKLRFAHGGA